MDVTVQDHKLLEKEVITLSEQAFALFLSEHGLPGRLGCKHFSDGDITTCSHCQKILAEGLWHLVNLVFTKEQLKKIGTERLPKIIGALVSAVIARGSKQELGERDNG